MLDHKTIFSAGIISHLDLFRFGKTIMFYPLGISQNECIGWNSFSLTFQSGLCSKVIAVHGLPRSVLGQSQMQQSYP